MTDTFKRASVICPYARTGVAKYCYIMNLEQTTLSLTRPTHTLLPRNPRVAFQPELSHCRPRLTMWYLFISLFPVNTSFSFFQGAANTKDSVLALAASAEAASEHPVGTAIVEASRARGVSKLEPTVEGFQATPGMGVSCTIVKDRGGKSGPGLVLPCLIDGLTVSLLLPLLSSLLLFFVAAGGLGTDEIFSVCLVSFSRARRPIPPHPLFSHVF